MEKQCKCEWGNSIVFNHGDSNARGVAILFSKKVNFRILETVRNITGRYQIVTIMFEEKKVALVNVYAPNIDDPDFFIEMFKEIARIDYDHIILGGDLNINLTEKDKKGGNQWKLTNSSKTINIFMEENAWVDAWRVLHPENFRFTWKTRKPLIMSRLDYFLMPQHLLGYLDQVNIISNCLSDHAFVSLSLQFNEEIRGRGYWKLNNSFLRKQEYVTEVNKIIDLVDFHYNEETKDLTWEMLKKDVTEYSYHFGKKQSQQRKQEKAVLNRRIATLEKKTSLYKLRFSKCM